MHMQSACSTNIQFELTRNLIPTVEWYVCDFMLNSSGKIEAFKPELIPRQSWFWLNRSSKNLLYSWSFYFEKVSFVHFFKANKKLIIVCFVKGMNSPSSMIEMWQFKVGDPVFFRNFKIQRIGSWPTPISTIFLLGTDFPAKYSVNLQQRGPILTFSLVKTV